jgi:uncharacterized membrane protein
LRSPRRASLWVLKRLRNHFLTGILIIIPLGITILILIWLFERIDGILQPLIVRVAGHEIPGVGFGVMLVLIYVVGLITSNLFGKRIYSYIERFFFYKITVVRQLYQGIKQILESFSSQGKNAFLRVILIEFPRKGMWSVAFITNETRDDSGQKLFSVFIPLAPNPTSGFVQIMKESDFIYTNISVEDAFKMVVSAGKFSPKESDFQDKIPKTFD